MSAQANLAVYGAFLDPRDTGQKVLGMVLAPGGHLTHGSPVNVSGKWFSFVGYEVDKDTETIDMRAFQPLTAFRQWGDKYLSQKPPALLRRRSDRMQVVAALVAKGSGGVRADQLEVVPGPGATRQCRAAP